MRWVYSLASLFSFLGAFYSTTPGRMLVFVILGFVTAFAAVLAFAAARIGAASQDEVYVPSPEEVDAMKRAAARKAQGPRAVPNAPAPTATPARPTPTHDGTMAISAADLARQRKPPTGGQSSS